MGFHRNYYISLCNAVSYNQISQHLSIVVVGLVVAVVVKTKVDNTISGFPYPSMGLYRYSPVPLEFLFLSRA